MKGGQGSILTHIQWNIHQNHEYEHQSPSKHENYTSPMQLEVYNVISKAVPLFSHVSHSAPPIDRCTPTTQAHTVAATT